MANTIDLSAIGRSCLFWSQNSRDLLIRHIDAQTSLYGVGLFLASLLTYVIWIIYFHPLSAFPGPKLAIVSNVILYLYATRAIG